MNLLRPWSMLNSKYQAYHVSDDWTIVEYVGHEPSTKYFVQRAPGRQRSGGWSTIGGQSNYPHLGLRNKTLNPRAAVTSALRYWKLSEVPRWY